jgi:predicted nucleic acid-binding protein
VDWLDAQAVETLYLSAVTVAELRFGIAAMPAGKRRKVLYERLEGDVLPVFVGRVLPFDLDASRAYTELMSTARSIGQAIAMADASIAAIAAARGFIVASRDAAPFHAAGVPIINPWAEAT